MLRDRHPVTPTVTLLSRRTQQHDKTSAWQEWPRVNPNKITILFRNTQHHAKILQNVISPPSENMNLNSPCFILHCTCLGASVGLPMCQCQCISRSVIYGYYELATSTWSWSLHLARYHPAARWRVDMSERGQFTNAAPLPDTATHGPHQWSLGSPGRNKGEKWAAI